LIATIPIIQRFSNYSKAKCYTVKVNGKQRSEFNDFLTRMNSELKDITELAELIRLIENVADRWGIRSSLDEGDLKPEDNAHRFVLPLEVHTNTNSKYGLRLYCVILSEHAIIF